ncbi:unnamed protein product [Musa acuminata subsp. malaccensis]|uniref:(wild Malaysian banana) hypothetical protein n=1 Tax=Musa acuminata subsp. malaccensis TaxID=214687 RepID=A0A804I911_MUSAM|nr:PREDICTED: uncharacterized protein LOC103977471 [Musa acuminata subsp. malaccensis]CAG1849324.1 unnamed protein product [Musa acuminata subsp. malaccensis]
MYVTRPLSTFKNAAGAVHQPPLEGPGSGYLLLQDEELQPASTCCWGACKCDPDRIQQLPFPQNKILTLSYSEQRGETTDTYGSAALFIPVPNQPLSTNRYYVITAKGKHKGKAYTCSKEEDMTSCCVCQCINDVKPKEFDHRDVYQQMEIVCYKGRFTARPVASDAIPPSILRKEYWRLHQVEHEEYALGVAAGLDEALRSRLPELHAAGVVVGRWYTPFVFVKEEMDLRDQVKHSAFYEVTLEQFWEEVYACENRHGAEKVAEVKAVVRGEAAFLDGKEAKRYDTHDVDGLVWFKPLDSGGGAVKLSFPVWERMKWEQSRWGWTGDEEQKVEKIVEYGGEGGWKSLRCYVLVERFAVRRMDGSLVLMVDFRHSSHKVKCIWE